MENTIIELQNQVSELKIKADKWDALEEEIGQFYEEDSDGDLCDVGEVAAMAFGFL